MNSPTLMRHSPTATPTASADTRRPLRRGFDGLRACHERTHDGRPIARLESWSACDSCWIESNGGASTSRSARAIVYRSAPAHAVVSNRKHRLQEDRDL